MQMQVTLFSLTPNMQIVEIIALDVGHVGWDVSQRPPGVVYCRQH